MPFETSSWIVEQISQVSHAKQIIIKRYVKFLESLAKNKKTSVKNLIKMTYNDARTTTGSNIRHILLEHGTLIIPGKTKKHDLKHSNTYKIPEGQAWKISLLSSLIQIRERNWQVLFDNEGEGLIEDEVKLMIDDICKN